MKAPRDSETKCNEKGTAIAAEEGLLGASLRAYDPFAAALGMGLAAEHFYIAKHGILWRHIQAVTQAGAEISPHAVTASLEHSGELENAGGPDYILSLSHHGVYEDESNARYFAKQILEAAAHRCRANYSVQLAAAAASGDDRKFEQLLAEMQQKLQAMRPAEEAGADYFLTDEQMEQIPPPRQLLGDILFEDTVTILFAPSGRWKSFLALSWAGCIATGTHWLGRPVGVDEEGADVIYICAEGGGGMSKRFRAWKRQQHISSAPHLLFKPVRLNLLDDASVTEFLAEIDARSCAPKLVVIDTLARSMPGGDENSGQDGSTAFDAADRIRQAFGCCVLIVGHPGKDVSRGIRGWSGYFNNADSVLSVNCPGKEGMDRLEVGDIVTLRCEKPKESEAFRDIYLTTDVVRWSTDTGDFEASLVIKAAPTDESIDEGSKLEKRIANLPKRQREAFEALRTMPNGAKYGEWRHACDMPEETFKDSRKALMRTHRLVKQDGEIYTVCLGRSENHPRVHPSPPPSPLGWGGRGGVSLDTTLPPQADGAGDFDGLEGAEGGTTPPPDRWDAVDLLEADVEETSEVLIARVTRELLDLGGRLNPPYPAAEGIPAGRAGWEAYIAHSPPGKIHVLLAKMELEKGKVQSGAGAV